jgi:hypothetical protein
LKSGHDTYEAAEKAAQAIKKRHPKLQVTVFDAKGQRHTIIGQSKLANASNKNRPALRTARNARERRHGAATAVKH